jgi:hypothetical protein
VPDSPFTKRPWDVIFLEAVAERDFWNTEVRTPALMLTAKQSGGGPAAHTTSTRNQCQPRSGKGSGSDRAAPPPSTEYCLKWKQNKCEHPCPAGRIHKCSFCADHRRSDCRKAATKKAKGSGKPSKGAGGKGKGSGKPRT